jgi:hypothetical protein
MLPRDLPKMRDQTYRHIIDPESLVRASTISETQQWLAGLADQLLTADLYWVRPDMAALAVSAGATLDETEWGLAARPTPSGLILFEDGIGSAEFGADTPMPRGYGSTSDKRSMRELIGDCIPIDACAWGTYGDECLVWLMLTRRRLQGIASLAVDLDRVCPLIPVGCVPIPAAGPVVMGDFDAGSYRTVLAALAASWLLMEQPTLIDRTVERPEKPVRKAYARAGRPQPEVTLIDLRRQYVPTDQDSGGDGEGRRYKHRFVVSGHWRNQAWGPEHSQRRRQWIPSYVKGPDGAPLLVTEKVNVWRR